jgi:hypothetical protein
MSSTYFDGRVVRIRATMHVFPIGEPRVDGGLDRFLFKPSCNGADNFAVVEFDEKRSEELWKLFGGKLPHRKTGQNLQVELIGNFSIGNFPAFGELGWSRARLSVLKIIAARSTLRTLARPNWDAPRPKIEEGRALRQLDASAIFAIFGVGPDQDDALKTTAQTKYRLDGHYVSRERLREIAIGTSPKSLGVNLQEITGSEPSRRTSGNIFTHKDDGQVEAAFSYENNWTRDPLTGWKLIQISLSVSK